MSGSGAAVEATVIQVSSSNSELVQRVEASFEAMNNVDCSEERKKSLRARYFYGIIFLITNLTAWFIRDYVFYVASICGIVTMYYFYAPRPSCCLNIFFITWTAILLIVMMAMSLHSKVNRGLLSSGIMAAYVVFLCWSAIRSEPADEKCNVQKPKNGHGDWTTVLGFLIAIGAIVMATFSTGIDSKSFQFRKDEVKAEDDIRYNYGFFHIIFSLGATYFAMLFISWNLENSASEWSMDVGWTSTWVKIINEWFAASIYMWKLIAPVVKQQPKVMNNEESVQQINNSNSP
ncbi:hypothetical protein GOBAR_DD03510 [Gossypium barbadense]|nr:hypothetical protein GOBAR_DD03510 [Gossypium barbadense]